jgi:hypothetical protein
MTGYIASHFPGAPRTFAEQDALIQNMLKAEGKLAAWACLKRAYHVGIAGYHRPNGFRFSGDLSQRTRQLAAAITGGTLPELRKDYVELNDIDVPRGSTPPWTTVAAVQRLR